MKHIFSRLTFSILILLLIYPNIIANSHETKPNFSYPKTVISLADSSLNIAMRNHNNKDIIQSLLQLTIAKNLISMDNFQETALYIERKAFDEKNPSTQAILYSIAAQLYQEYHTQNSYKINSRIYSTSTPSKDITEWSCKQIQDKILHLINLSLRNKDIIKDINISTFYGVIEYDKIGEILRPTIYDFIAYRNMDILSQEADNMPGGDIECKRLKKSILSQLLSLNINHYAPYIAARLYEINIQGGESERKLSILKELYNKYSSIPYSGLILENMESYYLGSTNNKRLKEYYNLITSFISHNPEYILLDNLKTIRDKMEQKIVHFTTTSYYSSSDSIKIDCNISNARIFDINIYAIPNNSTIDPNNIPLSKLKLVAQKKVTTSDTIPFFSNKILKMAPLSFGKYILTIDIDTLNNNRLEDRIVINVTDLFLYNISSADVTTAIGTNFISGKPEKDAIINYTPNKKSIQAQKAITNNDGMATFKNLEYGQLSISKGKDIYSNVSNTWPFYKSNDKRPQIKMNLYTDLKIYHPGDSVKYIGIAYYYSIKDKKCISDENFKIYLRNANYKEIDSINVISDKYGRFSGAFKIPETGLNGRYEIEANSEENNVSTSFNVSEYKAPTFKVEITNSKNNYSTGTSITLNGFAQTYFQMPLANDSVSITLTQSEWSPFWRQASGEKIIGEFNTTTDIDGKFSYILSKDLFYNGDENTEKSFKQYAANIKVTSNDGESQSTTTYFTIGNFSKLEFLSNNDDDVLEISHPIMLPIRINTNLSIDSLPKCAYRISSSKDSLIKKGEFIPNKTLIDLSNLTSGEYNIEVQILNDSTSAIDENFIFYRNSDKVCPSSTPLFVPKTKINCDKENIANILIGNSDSDSYIYHIAYSQDKIISKGWIKYAPGMHNFSLKIPKNITGAISANLICVKNGSQITINIQIIPYFKEDSLKMEISSFRDKINSGEKESWTIKFTDSKNRSLSGALIAELYDKALDAIASNIWYFKPQYYYPSLIDIQQWNNYMNSNNVSSIVKFNNIRIKYPTLYTYNRSLLPRSRYYNGIMGITPTIREYKCEVILEGRNNINETSNVTEDTLTGITVNESNETAPENNIIPDLNKIPLRDNKIKVALWKPDITIDKNGKYKIEFETPNINTTWQFQAIGYTTNMMSNMIHKEVVSSKPLMVHINAPRFLRQGDTATFIGSIFNTTDTIQKCNSRIEIFNPQTNEVITNNQQVISIEAKRENNVSISWSVPDSLSAIGIKVIGANTNYSDGEQIILPILPSISPIIESEPFVIPADSLLYNMTLKKIPNEAKVSFNYCNNPIWYCIAALPSIETKSAITASQLSNNIFSLGISQGLVNSNSKIKEAIEYWKKSSKDSTLISLLLRNNDLKISSITNNPFLSASEKETADMTSLTKLLDEKYIQSKIDTYIENLKSLQDSNGGWSWYKGGNTSYYITNQVLYELGEIRSYGYLKNDTVLFSMLHKGIKYCDNEIFKMYNKQHNKNDLSIFCRYLFVRDFYNDIPLSSALASFKKTAISKLTDSWDKYPIDIKGYIALLMIKNGNQPLAKRILESIRQFSSLTKNQSIYWDNLDIYPLNDNKESTTALLLQAFNAIEPQSKDINKIRQWLILQKYTNNWGNNATTSRIIYSILSSGSNWCQPISTPIIKLNDMELRIDSLSRYTGEIKKDILLNSGTNSISIQRDSKNPAWGSVIYAYKDTMNAIKAKGIEGLSLEKKIYKIDGDNLFEANNLNVGDKIKIQLIIKTAQDLDYVALTDERAATLEPINQLSGNSYKDELIYYLELKNSSSNLFFYSIPKGTYLISYDMHVTNQGKYNSGIATIQSQYAPEITAHSSGEILNVK